jgi:RimJ/RimL family protein N-acetyltransferase
MLEYPGASMSEAFTSGAALWAIEWRSGGEVLTAIEPTEAEIAGASSDLAAHYNDAHNRRMMAHVAEPFTALAVATYYRELREEGGRPFLLQRAEAGVPALLGDGDLRNIQDQRAEVAIMIGSRATQGRGLGTRYATMLHAFAFQVLGLGRLYVSVIPANVASRRLFEKLGYQLDDSPQARELIDEATDLTLSVSRARFATAAAASLAEIRIYEREETSFR